MPPSPKTSTRWSDRSNATDVDELSEKYLDSHVEEIIAEVYDQMLATQRGIQASWKADMEEGFARIRQVCNAAHIIAASPDPSNPSPIESISPTEIIPTVSILSPTRETQSSVNTVRLNKRQSMVSEKRSIRSSIFESSLLQHKNRRRRETHAIDEGPPVVKQLSHQAAHWPVLIVESMQFELFCGFLIAANVVLIGIETQYMSQHGNISSELYFLQIALNTWYVFELFLRFLAAGHWRFFHGEDWRWNLLDIFFVTTSIIDVILESIEMNGLEVKALRVIRIIRILRAFRMARIVKNIRELQKMAFALASSVQTLFWALVLLFFVMYTFAIWMCKGVTDFLRDNRNSVDEMTASTLENEFGSIFQALYTLYLAITNGVAWGSIAKPLKDAHWTLMAIFLLYISISLYAVTNIVLSVFVECAMQSIHRSRELLVEEKKKNKEMYVSHMKQIFHQIDKDGSGTINLIELVKFFNEDHPNEIQSYFEALELNSSDVDALFKLLDADDSGEVDIEEFTQGCMQMKGEAKNYDIKILMFEILRIERQLAMFVPQVEQQLTLLTNTPWRKLSQYDSTFISPATEAKTSSKSALARPSVTFGDHHKCPSKRVTLMGNSENIYGI